jgi:tripartite-type tricarboxylate transporter receptor subunit TctC
MQVLLWVALGLTSLIAPATAQTFPTRPVTFVVPFAPGGTTDALARVIAKSMSVDLQQPVIVDNAGGAGGTIGTTKVVRARPDGYTLTFGNMGSLAANVALYPKLAFDPRRDLVPVGLVANVPMMLSVSKASGVTDMAGFMSKLKQGDIKFGNAGPGSTGHLAAATFLHVTETKATLVPYRGAGPAINDLMAGIVDAVIDQTVTMIPMHKGGRVTSIAVSSNARLPQVPDVPTFVEAGTPKFDLTVWNAIAAPKGTPPAVVERLQRALAAALNDAEVRQRFDDFAAQIPSSEEQGSQALGKLIAADVERLGAIIKSGGIVAE